MEPVKVIDVKEACCMDTLSRPIEDAMASLGPNEVAEFQVRPSFQKMVYRLATDKGYTIVEEFTRENEICFRMAQKEAQTK